MPTSALLVRWNGGWHEVIRQLGVTLFGRREAFLSLGAVQSVGEAIRLAEAELRDQFAKTREQTTAEHAPVDLTEIPYVAYRPSDRITTENFVGGTAVYTVQAMTVSEDDDGEVTFQPTIGDTIIGVEELQREIRAAYSKRENRAIPA